MASTTAVVKRSAIPVVAIDALQANGISPDQLRVITDEISTQIQSSGVFRVMERSQMDRILKEQNFQQSGACDGSECAVEIGRVLGIDRMVLGSVGLIGSTYTLHLRLVDVATGEILRNASTHQEGRIDEVLTKLVPKAVDILTRAAASSPAVASPVVPAPAPVVAPPAPVLATWTPAPADGPRVVARFESVPPGALVTDNGIDLCKTPCQKAIPKGNHALLWELEGWETRRDTVVLRESNQKFASTLVEKRSELSVEALSAESQEDLAAEVWIDGVKVGSTPWQGAVSSHVRKLSVKLAGYRDLDTSVAPEKGARSVLRLALQKRDAWRLTLPDRGEVRVGGRSLIPPFAGIDVPDSLIERTGARWITPWGERKLLRRRDRLQVGLLGFQPRFGLGLVGAPWFPALATVVDVEFPLTIGTGLRLYPKGTVFLDHRGKNSGAEGGGGFGATMGRTNFDAFLTVGAAVYDIRWTFRIELERSMLQDRFVAGIEGTLVHGERSSEAHQWYVQDPSFHANVDGWEEFAGFGVSGTARYCFGPVDLLGELGWVVTASGFDTMDPHVGANYDYDVMAKNGPLLKIALEL